MESKDIIQLTELFRQKKLPKSQWTHHAHIAVSLGFLATFHHVEETLPNLREAIQSYNISVGTANTDSSGYHETLTFFWLVVASEFSNTYQDLSECYHAFLKNILAHKSSPTLFYTKTLLFSVEARKERVLPDLLALSEISTFIHNKVEPHFIWSDTEFEEHFANGTLDPALFTHEAHLRLAWIHLSKYGEDVAIQNISSQLERFVAMLGMKDKYHKTLTIASIKMIGHLIQRKNIADFNIFIQTYPRLKNDFSGLIHQHYTPDALNTEDAKKAYVEPNILTFG